MYVVSELRVKQPNLTRSTHSDSHGVPKLRVKRQHLHGKRAMHRTRKQKGKGTDTHHTKRKPSQSRSAGRQNGRSLPYQTPTGSIPECRNLCGGSNGFLERKAYRVHTGYIPGTYWVYRVHTYRTGYVPGMCTWAHAPAFRCESGSGTSGEYKHVQYNL